MSLNYRISIGRENEIKNIQLNLNIKASFRTIIISIHQIQMQHLHV